MKAGSKGLDLATLMYENKKIMVKLTAFMRFMEDYAIGENDPISMEGYIGEAESEVIGKRTKGFSVPNSGSEEQLKVETKNVKICSQKAPSQKAPSHKMSSGQI